MPRGQPEETEAATAAAAAAAEAEGAPLARAAAGAAAYGATAGPAGAAKAEGHGKAGLDDVVSSGDGVRVFEWEQRGAPWQLLISAGTLVAKQYAALALICLQVFFIGSGERKYLMSCNPFVIGWGGAYFCEYSKTCVRCFPLMAMVVSLVVAARLILNQRAFYLLLRRGVLVDFDNFRPLSDPLTWILLWTLASAFCHFLFDMWKTAGSAKDFRTIDPEGVIVFYFAPAIYFMMFLYSSYDIEEMLMPLSKFWEEDPEWARRASAGLVFVHERSLAKAVLRQGLRLEPRAEEAAEALRPVPAERHAAEELQRLGAAEAAAEEAGEEDLHADFELSRWRHVSAMWASQLLLDSGLQDDQSRHFCWMWLVFCATSAAAMLFALFFFAYQIYTDVGDIFWPPYENTDIPSLVVETLYLLFTGMIAWRFWKNLLGYTL